MAQLNKTKSIMDNPRLQEIDAILIHTGTNDLEDSSLDAQTIASNLLQVTNNATIKFPSAEVFLSEITPRRDEFKMNWRRIHHSAASAKKVLEHIFSYQFD